MIKSLVWLPISVSDRQGNLWHFFLNLQKMSKLDNFEDSNTVFTLAKFSLTLYYTVGGVKGGGGGGVLAPPIVRG